MRIIKNVCLLIMLFSVSSTLAADKVVVVPLNVSKAKVDTKIFTKNYSAGEFRTNFKSPGAEAGYSYNMGERYRITNLSNAASAGLTADLDLPDGSIILGVTCYIKDNDADLNARSNTYASIYRREFTSPTLEDIITPIDMSTSGQSTDIIPISSSSITYPTIDTDTYYYHIRFFIQLGDNSNGIISPPVSSSIDFWGCSISYSVDVLTM